MSPRSSATYCEIDFPQGDGRLRLAFSAPDRILVAHRPAEVASVLHEVETLARAGNWAVGVVSYEAAPAFDGALPTRAGPLPLAVFALFKGADPVVRTRGEFLCGAWHDGTPRDRFDAGIAAIHAAIREGRCYQVNYTTRLQAPFFGDARALFDSLKASQPDAYGAYLEFDRWRICSVSPELFFHWCPDTGVLLSRPMKGTAARDDDPQRDRELAARLVLSAKERAENLMIVDLIRNDMSRVAELGSVTVPELFRVEAWPTVWQMTSTVACRTRPQARLADVFGALFPCGSVTGAPKVAAMAAIRALEAEPRGAYCGAIGIVKPGGEAVFNVGIRTVVVDAERAIAECGIGSGIVIDSTATGEHAEWQAKQVFLRRACPEYELLETLRLHRGRYWLRRGHLVRLADSAARLGFGFDRVSVDRALDTAARGHPTGQWRARLRLAGGGGVAVDVLPLDQTPAAARVALAPTAIDSRNPWLRHKTTRRGSCETLSVRETDVFDTLLYNERGETTEFTRGNLVADIAGRRLTPPLASGLLPGVLRQALLSSRRVEEGVVTLTDLPRADALWFVNSLRGMVPVRLLP